MKIKYFTEFTSADGKHHWAIHTYNTMSGVVDMMKDFKFDDRRYDVKYKSYDKRYYVIKRNNSRFDVIDNNNGELIGIFYDEFEAQSFCSFKNKKHS